MTYREARAWAAAIRQAVVQRAMPPWHSDPNVGQYIWPRPSVPNWKLSIPSN